MPTETLPIPRSAAPSTTDDDGAGQLSHAILSGINRIFHEALTCQTEDELGRVCLAVAEEVTQSRCGFIGEINPQTGILGEVVISDRGWKRCEMPVPPEDSQRHPVDRVILNLYRLVLEGGRGFFTNNPAPHVDTSDMPPDHPPLTAFLGAPLKHGEQVIGMIGLGNRDGGYSVAELDALEALTPAVVQALQSKRADTALRETQRRLELAQSAARVGMFEWEPQTNREFWSPQNLALYGLTAENFKGDGSDWGERVLPEDLPAARERARRALETGEYDSEYRIRRKDNGAVVWIQARGRVYYDDEGAPTRLIGINLDITARKQAEEQIRRYSADLEQQVAQRTSQIQQLERQRHEAEKYIAIGQMAARIAHEINNPLAGVWNSFLLVKPAIPADFRYYEFVGCIERELQRIARIVRQLFELYRPEPRISQPMHPDQALVDVAVMLEPGARTRGIRLEIDTAAAAQTVLVHEDTVKQVLFSLVQNAIDASPDGATVRLAAALTPHELTLTVTDEGAGISPEIREQIFEPFFTTKDYFPNSGLGLGLAVAHGLIESRGGSIRFESEVGTGTTFVVTLPLEEAAATPATMPLAAGDSV